MSQGPKVFVMVDMEGISGIYCTPQVAKDSGEPYQAGRRFLTWDINACVQGCFNGGAERVVVRDAHGGGTHALWDQLDSRADYIQGRVPWQRMPHLEDFDALILLGYHAMAGTPRAILEHTMNSVLWQNLWINGRRSGEIAVDAGIAGDLNIPTILVSGDDKTCAEARDFVPGIVTAQVKEGMDVQGGQLLGRERAHAVIRESTEQAVRHYREIPPYKVSAPVTMRLELVSRGLVPEMRPGVKMIDGRTYEVTAESVERALMLLG